MREKLQPNIADRATAGASVLSATVKALPGRAELDNELMVQIVKNADRSAFSDLGGHYAPRIKGWLMCRGEQPSTAEDVAQDVLISVWTRANQFNPTRGAFSSWIFRMARNAWIDHKRKHDRLQPTEPEIISIMADSSVAAADEKFDELRTAQAIQAELAKLPVEQKQMLHLAFFEGLSHSQIAVRTGLALGTVKSRIRVPLKNMRSNLENFRGGDQ